MYLFPLALLLSCEKEAPPVEERAIGFLTSEPDFKWHIGTEAAIQVVKDLDKLWSVDDYEAMKPFFVDTARFYFPDGTVAKSPEEFIEIVKKQSEGVDQSWTFDSVFSVDLNPAEGGEHVHASFTGTTIRDGVTSKRYLHEHYYIIQGKIVYWVQYAAEGNDEEAGD